MKIAILSDWLTGEPSFGGGGEVYAINIALMLLKYNDVTIYTNKVKDKEITFYDVLKHYGATDKQIQKLEIKYAPTNGWSFYERIFGEIHVSKFLARKINYYDLFINCSDPIMNGFANFKNCKKSTPSIKIVHFPWNKVNPNFRVKPINNIFYNYQNKYEASYNAFFANSQFTASWIKKVWNNPNVEVAYAPIGFKPASFNITKNKENIILYIGRILEDKKCLEMAHVFKNIYKHNNGWKLIIAGNFIPHTQDYISKIRSTLKNTNHELIFDLQQPEIVNLYEKSKIFWNAKGFGTDNPWIMEHFGMTCVEAMTQGCIPVVINKGGQPEIVDDGVNGFTWNTFEEMYEKTLKIINDENLQLKLSKKAIIDSEKFLMPAFSKNFVRLIKKHTGLDIKV